MRLSVARARSGVTGLRAREVELADLPGCSSSHVSTAVKKLGSCAMVKAWSRLGRRRMPETSMNRSVTGFGAVAITLGRPRGEKRSGIPVSQGTRPWRWGTAVKPTLRTRGAGPTSETESTGIRVAFHAPSTPGNCLCFTLDFFLGASPKKASPRNKASEATGFGWKGPRA